MAFLTIAYHLPRHMISGPDWLTTDLYNIDARLSASATRDDFRLMLQHLLKERFKLMVHREKTAMAVYELVMAKNGPKFKESNRAAETPLPSTPSNPSVSFSINKDGCPEISEGGPPMMAFGDCFVVRQRRQPIDWLVSLLSTNADRPILDATGLKGSYDFAFYYRSEKRARSTSTEAPNDSADLQNGPGLFKAVEEQLGLRLQARRSLVDRIVIDRMERRPTAN